MNFATVAALCSICCCGSLIYAFISFGFAILFHIGWQLCSAIDSDVCSGNIADAVIYITMGTVVTNASQTYYLRKDMHLKLFLNMCASQQVGFAIGTWVLFSAFNSWIPRSLGIIFFLLASEKMVTESKLCARRQLQDIAVKGEAVEPGDVSGELAVEEWYKFDQFNKFALVWITGFCSGIFNGVFGAGGPPLMMFASYTNIRKNEMRSLVANCYLVAVLSRIVFLLFFQSEINVYTVDSSVLFGALSLVAVCSVVVGNYYAHLVDQNTFRIIILVILTMGAGLLIATDMRLQMKLIVIVCTICFIVILGGIVFRREYLNLISERGTRNEVEVEMQKTTIAIDGLHRTETVVSSSSLNINSTAVVYQLYPDLNNI